MGDFEVQTFSDHAPLFARGTSPGIFLNYQVFSRAFWIVTRAPGHSPTKADRHIDNHFGRFHIAWGSVIVHAPQDVQYQEIVSSIPA